MILSFWDWIGIILAFTAVFSGIFLSSRQSSSVDGFSVGGRSASMWLVAGSLIGTIVGGSATIGTTQAAVHTGFSAGWFALGSALGLAALGLCYAVPLRRSGLKTIAEFMHVHYGHTAGVATSIVSVLGIFFSLVASGISGIHFIQILFPVSTLYATLILLISVVIYVLAGGIKGTAVSGIIRTVLLYACLFLGGIVAVSALGDTQISATPLLSQPWLYPQGIFGWQTFATNCLSVIIGVMVTQSYAQAVYSATDTRSAVRGCLLAAVGCLPIALPLISIGLYMGQYAPNVSAVVALPVFMQLHLPPILGGLALGIILLSIIGSIAGLALGASTSIAVDIFEHGFGIRNPRYLFFLLQGSLVLVTVLSFALALRNYDSQILYWNFLSFSLRGAGIFFPFLLAVYARQFSHDYSITANILCATFIAVLSVFFPLDYLSLNPLYVGMTISVLWLVLEYLFLPHHRPPVSSS